MTENMTSSVNTDHHQKRLVRWRFPEEGWVVASCDGSVKKEGGTACGGLLRDDTGMFVLGFSAKLEPTSVNIAEMTGVYKALCAAWDRGFRKVRVDCDSDSALDMIKNFNNETHRAFQVVSQVRDLLQRPWEVNLFHVFREANRVADVFANMGHEQQDFETKWYEEAPMNIIPLIRDDLMQSWVKSAKGRR